MIGFYMRVTQQEYLMPQILFQAREPKGSRLAHGQHTRVRQHVHVCTPKTEPREFGLPNYTF